MPKILFEVVQDYYWPAMEPIYRIMAKDPTYDLQLHIGPNQKRIAGVVLVSQRKRIEASYRARGFVVTDRQTGFDAVILGDTIKHPERFGGALPCNVDHGPCFKTLRYRNLLKQPDTRYVVFAEGRYRMEKLAKYGLDKMETCFDVGLPKLDPFFWGEFDRGEIVKRYALDPAKKIVLYAPTYKPTSIFLIGEYLPKLLADFNVIVKLHPYSWTGKYAPHSQHRLFERLAKVHPALHLVPPTDHNIMPYLWAADTMISEGSSAINEYLALGRCGIIVDLDDDHLKHHDGENLLEERTDLWLKDSFVHIRSGDDLHAAAIEAVDPSPRRRARLDRDKQYIFSCTDGSSSLRVKQAIESLLTRSRTSA